MLYLTLIDRFMQARLEDAVWRTNQCRFRVENKLRRLVLHKSDVQSVLVLWSADPSSVLEEHEPEVMNGTTVLLGSELAAWLGQFDESHRAHFDTDAVWAEVERLASSGDDLDSQQGLTPSPGLLSSYLHTVVAPVVAVFLAIDGFFASAHLGWGPSPWLETATAVLLGFAGSRTKRLRLTSIAWTAAAVGVFAIVGLDLVVDHFAGH
jgi:hypothetical protein